MNNSLRGSDSPLLQGPARKGLEQTAQTFGFWRQRGKTPRGLPGPFWRYIDQTNHDKHAVCTLVCLSGDVQTVCL